MGLPIKDFDKYFNEEAELQAFTVDKLSNAVVRVMDRIAKDEDIFKLLYFEDGDALSRDLELDDEAREAYVKRHILKHNHPNQRIKAYPFNPSAQTEHQVFIRVYFNQGSLARGGYSSKAQMNIDIINSHGLWLTSDSDKKLKVVRPYAIMSRIIEILQSEKIDKLPIPTGYNHLTVNEKFECLRIYANMISLEGENRNEIE